MENRGDGHPFIEERGKLGRAVVAVGDGKLVAGQKKILFGSVSYGESYKSGSSPFRAS